MEPMMVHVCCRDGQRKEVLTAHTMKEVLTSAVSIPDMRTPGLYAHTSPFIILLWIVEATEALSSMAPRKLWPASHYMRQRHARKLAGTNKQV